MQSCSKSNNFSVENKNGVIVHTLDTVKGLQEGQIVGLQVDKKTREGITRHHTATHVVNTSSRRVLGEHVWQEGTKKDFDKDSVLSRFDHQLKSSGINTSHTLSPDFSWSPSDISQIKNYHQLEKYIILFPFCISVLQQSIIESSKN